LPPRSLPVALLMNDSNHLPKPGPAAQSFRERTIVRFAVTATANVFRLALSFLSGLVVARGLGAANYGDFSFLLGSFTAINLILDMGSSPAYYTFLAARKRKPTFFLVYLLWTIGIQFGGTVLVLWLILPERAVHWVWAGQGRNLVLLAFGVSFMTTQIWTMVSQLGEALRRTIIVQACATTQALLHLILVAYAAHRGWLSVQIVFWFLIAEYALLALVLGIRFLPESMANSGAQTDTVRSTVADFVRYCKPLVVYGWVGFFYHFADRWLLQTFGGSRQQGFFSIGQQFGAVSLLATTSIINVFWKEIAEARERHDSEREKKLYMAVRRALYFCGAWLSCLLIPYCREIVRWALGADYGGAWLPLAIMLIYPIHQSVGQIQGTVFYATGHTAAYSKIGVFMMLISIPIAYLMLAPRSAAVPGLNLGAVGLALKLVFLQLLSIGLLSYKLKRLHGWGTDYSHEAIVLLLLLTLGFTGRFVAGGLVAALLPGGRLTTALAGSIFYGVTSIALLYFRPMFIGIPNSELKRILGYRPSWLRPVSVAD